MKDIAIYGAGGFGREVACLILKINECKREWNLIGFFDDGICIGTRNEYGEILGGLIELNNYPKALCVAIAIGSPQILKNISSKIVNRNIEFPNLIAPNVILLDSNNYTLGKGNIISFGCTISCNVRIGDFNILNWNTTIGHDVSIHNFNAFMPAVCISGEVIIGNTNFFGVSSTVLQQLKIGEATIIGANSLITRNTRNKETYIGSPATILRY